MTLAMDGPAIEHSDSDSGDSWTLLENSAYADDTPDISELPGESPTIEHHEKDEDTDGISIISDSEPDSPSPCQMIYETLEENRPPEHETAEYISVDPQLTKMQNDHESIKEEDDLLDDSRRKNKTYVHRRNKRLSTVLNIVVLASVITAAGVAIGHMWGAKTDCTLQNTPGINKILSRLYRLQEENAYLRNKLKEITALNNHQANNKVPLKQNKCRKVFEESLQNDNTKKLTTCVDDRIDNDNRLLKSHMIQVPYEKDFVQDIGKLKNINVQNKSWINEKTVKKLKQVYEHLENMNNSPNAYNENDTKHKFTIKMLPEILEQSDNEKPEDHTESRISYADSLKYSGIVKNNNNNRISDKYDISFDNHKNEFKRENDRNTQRDAKESDNMQYHKKISKRDSDKMYENKIDYNKKANPRGEFDEDIDFYNENNEDRKFNKIDDAKILDEKIDYKNIYQKERVVNSLGKMEKLDKRFNKRDSDKIFEAKLNNRNINPRGEFDEDIDFYNENNEDRKFNKIDDDKIVDEKIDYKNIYQKERVVNSLGKMEKLDKRFNKRDSDKIFEAKLNNQNINPRGEFDDDIDFPSIDDGKLDEKFNENDHNNFISKSNINKKQILKDYRGDDDLHFDKDNEENKKFNKKDYMKVFAIKEAIDKKFERNYYGDTDSLFDDFMKKDNRYTGPKHKQERKKYDRQKLHKKDKKRNKYEQWEMKGGLMKDYDDISLASTQDNVVKEQNLRGDTGERLNYRSNNKIDSSTATLDVDYVDNKSAGHHLKNNQNDKMVPELNWVDRRAVIRKEARKRIEKELFDDNPTTAGWYFKRMRKREQCRAKGDNSTYRKLSKQFKNYKTKT
ncbi:unnamed protein product, partial [Brenthis ino]